MEAATTPEETTEAPQPVAETSPAEDRHPQELFRYSDWLHVGPGAEDCDGGEDGSCTNEMHFHAWCRLPNQFQHQSIREKALAAKARRIRAYRDADSDASAVLDGQLEEVEYTLGDAAHSTYIEEIVYKDFMKDYFEVAQEMSTEESEDDDPPPWASIEEDRERLRVLDDMDPTERPEAEYEELKSHIAEYQVVLEDRVKERQQPVRESLQERPMDELRNMVREERVQKESQAVYMQTYTVWEQYIGTLKPQKQGIPAGKPEVAERAFKDVNHLKAAAPEVVQALDDTFTRLDGEFGKTMTSGASGKG